MSAPHTHRDLIRRALATSAPSVVQAGAGEPPGESGEGDEHDPLVIANRSQGKRPREAGVLVPLVEREAGLNLILTRRSEHLPTHAGQISFPGGSQDPDDRDAVDTALREAEEEIGLQRRLVDIAGSLDRYETGTGFILNPVVGFVDPAFTPRADPGEVAEVFEVPLAFVLDPANHQRMTAVRDGRRRRFFAMTYETYFIWGATAGVIIDLQRRLEDL